MCEETANYLWAKQDLLGHGATSQVFKAYNKTTGELVAAKVYQSSSNIRDKDFKPILDREMDVLKATDHENIIRYIALESVKSSDASIIGAREALFIEYCNGGSLHNVLELPENRYGLMEDEFMLVFRHLTGALKYLHDKNTIHRDIKPDNIMLLINTNGKRTYKLADLGVARLINEGESAFQTLVGTEEYIHPALYRAAVRDTKVDVLPSALEARACFPFEVDLWSLGVTLYQCATGALPFQPFAGTRKDRTGMKRILDTKPPGSISGIENTRGGKIEYSKTLPDSCRLSSSLKRRLESLLQRLLESEVNKLMSFHEFFTEVDHILNLTPIYYLNLKRFKLSCGYFEPTQSTTRLYDELHQENGDENNEEYYCLFQNVPYPISKKKRMSIAAFCEQLPIPTSHETPLVFCSFSSIDNASPYVPKLNIPTVKPMRQYNDVASACEWSNDIVGLFFYIKSQLVQYKQMLQTAQFSTTIMQQHLKSKLLEFLCSIRAKLTTFRAFEELKNILDQIDINTSGHTTPTNSSMNSNSGNGSTSKSTTTNRDTLPIGFSHLLLNPSSNENNESSGTVHRSSSMHLVQQSMRIFLRQYVQSYEELKKCEQDILQMIEKEFSGQLDLLEDQQPYVNTLWLSNRTKLYSSLIQRTDKHLKDLHDLNESFRQDRLLSNYNRLQSDSHFLRRKKLEELHKRYVKFATEECYPHLLESFREYNEWIRQRSDMIRDFERIQQSYEKQCENIATYVDMIDNLRDVVYRNIRELTSASMYQSTNESNQGQSSTTVRQEQSQPTEQLFSASEPNAAEDTNKTMINKIRGTTKRSIQHAEESLNKLDSVLKQLRISIHKK